METINGTPKVSYFINGTHKFIQHQWYSRIIEHLTIVTFSNFFRLKPLTFLFLFLCFKLKIKRKRKKVNGFGRFGMKKN